MRLEKRNILQETRGVVLVESILEARSGGVCDGSCSEARGLFIKNDRQSDSEPEARTHTTSVGYD